MDHKYKLKFFDLEPTLEPNPTFEPKLDFPEAVLVPNPIILELNHFIKSNSIVGPRFKQ